MGGIEPLSSVRPARSFSIHISEPWRGLQFWWRRIGVLLVISSVRDVDMVKTALPPKREVLFSYNGWMPSIMFVIFISYLLLALCLIDFDPVPHSL